MILVALFLGSLGIADLVRLRLPFARSLWVATAAASLVFALGAVGVELDWWWTPIAIVAIVGWLVATREDSAAHRTGYGHRTGYWALAALAVALVAAIVYGPALGTPAGPLVDWYTALPYARLAAIPFTAFALTVGAIFFLFESSNVIVRLALRGERSMAHDPAALSAPAAPTPPSRRWWRRPVPTTAESTPPQFTELKGGRFIGPLERVFLLALVLTGQFTAVAAVIAAKGIVRFPEISKDQTGGSKAEYFLVGSFASWAIVVVVATLVALVA